VQQVTLGKSRKDGVIMDSERSKNKHPPQRTSKNIRDPAAQFCHNNPLVPTSFIFLSGKFAWQCRQACVRGAD